MSICLSAGNARGYMFWFAFHTGEWMHSLRWNFSLCSILYIIFVWDGYSVLGTIIICLLEIKWQRFKRLIYCGYERIFYLFTGERGNVFLCSIDLDTLQATWYCHILFENKRAALKFVFEPFWIRVCSRIAVKRLHWLWWHLSSLFSVCLKRL